jgi:hypothetical protein
MNLHETGATPLLRPLSSVGFLSQRRCKERAKARGARGHGDVWTWVSPSKVHRVGFPIALTWKTMVDRESWKYCLVSRFDELFWSISTYVSRRLRTPPRSCTG